MKNSENNDESHLEAMIRQQKELNDSLRASANILHSLVQKLSGDYPNLIYEYDNQEKKQALVGVKSNETYYTFLVSETKGDGYRNFGDFKNSNLNFRVKKKISKDSWLSFNFNIVDSPYSNDPGGLKIEEVNTDREQARERNLQYNTSEEINHYKFSSSFNKKINEKLSFSTYAFISNRNFNGKIPVKNGGAIDLKRKYWGFGGSFLFN